VGDDADSWLPDGFSFLSGLPTEARKRRFVVPLQVYADESGGKGQGRYFAMAGLLAHSEDWAVFSEQWAHCLRQSPAIRLFKMKDAAGLSGEFYGWSATARDEKLVALASIINRYVISVTYSVIDLDAFAKYWRTRLSKPMSDPYFMPYQNTILATAFDLDDHKWKERFEIVFDEHVILGPRAHRWYPMLLEIVRLEHPSVMPLMPISPTFQRDDEFMPLQAADLYAWCIRKGTQQAPNSDFDWLLRELTNVKLNQHAQFYDETRMQSVVDMSDKYVREGVPQALLEKFRDIYGDQQT